MTQTKIMTADEREEILKHPKYKKLVLASNINALLVELIDINTIELENELKRHKGFRHQTKAAVKKVQRSCAKLVGEVEKGLERKGNVYAYADKSDFLYKLLELGFEIRGQDEKVMAESQLKMLIKKN